MNTKSKRKADVTSEEVYASTSKFTNSGNFLGSSILATTTTAAGGGSEYARATPERQKQRKISNPLRKTSRSDDTLCPAVEKRLSHYHCKMMILNKQMSEWAAVKENQLLKRVLGSSDSGSAALPYFSGGEYVDLAKNYVHQSQSYQELYNRPSGQIFMFGTGIFGALGLGEARQEAARPRKVRNLMDVPVIQIACGGLHNAAVTSEGSVYTWGCDDDGTLGRESVESSEYLPMKVEDWGYKNDDEEEEVFNRVAAGDSQTLVCTLSGKVYVFGTYKDNEGKTWRDLKEPMRVGMNDKEASKVCRGIHEKPHRVIGIENAEDVVCGSTFNAARLKGGGIVTWGIGVVGELGRDVPPMKYPEDPILAKEDDYRGPGYNVLPIANQQLTPLPPRWADGITSRFVESIACGGYHLLVVTSCGGCSTDGPGTRVFTTGLNNYGQLGHGDKDERKALTRIEALDECNVRHIAGGVHHSVCVDGDGNVLSFGRGDSGQLGITKTSPKAGYCEDKPVHVSALPKDDPVMQISCGGNHNMAITKKGDTYTWGFGEQGALGHGKLGWEWAVDDDGKEEKIPVGKDEYLPKKLVLEDKSGGKKVRVYQADGGGQHSALICRMEE